MEPPAKRRRLEEQSDDAPAQGQAHQGTASSSAAPSVDAMILPELKPVFQQLTKWFELHGGDPALEIEARLKGISEGEFLFILRTLDSFKGWSHRLEERTVDIRYSPSGIRETISLPAGSKPPVYLVKSSLMKADYTMPEDGLGLRITVNAEDHCAPATNDGSSRPDSYRYKQRLRFVHRGEIAYDCTIVRSSSTWEEAQASIAGSSNSGASSTSSNSSTAEWEIEVEWCGQQKVKEEQLAAKARSIITTSVAAGGAGGGASGAPSVPSPYLDPSLLAAKFTLKLQDLQAMRRKHREQQHQAQQAQQVQQVQQHYALPVLPPPPSSSSSSSSSLSAPAAGAGLERAKEDKKGEAKGAAAAPAPSTVVEEAKKENGSEGGAKGGAEEKEEGEKEGSS